MCLHGATSGLALFYVLLVSVVASEPQLQNRGAKAEWITHPKLRASRALALGGARASQALLELELADQLPRGSEQPVAHPYESYEVQAYVANRNLLGAWHDPVTVRHVKRPRSATPMAPAVSVPFAPHPWTPHATTGRLADDSAVAVVPRAGALPPEPTLQPRSPAAVPVSSAPHASNGVESPENLEALDDDAEDAGAQQVRVPRMTAALAAPRAQIQPTGRGRTPAATEAWWRQRWLYEALALMVTLALCRNFLLALVYNLWQAARRDARPVIADATPTTIAEAADGAWAKIIGTVVADPQAEEDLLESPLRGVQCVYYHAVVESAGRSGRRSACRDFFIEDDAGERIAVYRGDVEGYHLTTASKEEHGAEALPVACATLLGAVHVPAPTEEGDYASFEEATIAVGARVVAVGIVVRDPDTGAVSLQSDTAVYGEVDEHGRAKQGLERPRCVASDKTLPPWLSGADEHGTSGPGCMRETLRMNLDDSELHRVAVHVLVSDNTDLF